VSSLDDPIGTSPGLPDRTSTVTGVAHYPRLPVELFRFTTGERAELNTATLCAFGAANERLETWLTLGEVAARLRTVEYYAPVAEEELLRVLGASGTGSSSSGPRTTARTTPPPRTSSATTCATR